MGMSFLQTLGSGLAALAFAAAVAGFCAGIKALL